MPLGERAKEISAFVTPDGFYLFRVMPYGIGNYQASLQRPMNRCLGDISGIYTNIDDNDTCKEYVNYL